MNAAQHKKFCTRSIVFELGIQSWNDKSVSVPSPLSETGLPPLYSSREGEEEKLCTQPQLLAEYPASSTCFWQTASELLQIPYTVSVISSSCFQQ